MAVLMSTRTDSLKDNPNMPVNFIPADKGIDLDVEDLIQKSLMAGEGIASLKKTFKGPQMKSALSHKFNKSKFRSGSNKNLVCCYGVIIPTELLHLRHGLSLLIGIHQPPLVADFCRSMTPLTQRLYVLVSWK